MKECLSNITVIVPNYNDAIYIKKCLLSIITQTKKAFDVIILDDSSTDESVSIIKSLIDGHPNMQLILNSHRLGPTENSNKGLSLVRTNYVIFLSANDYFYNDLLHSLELAANKFPKAGIISGLIDIVDINDNLIKPYQSPLLSYSDIYISPQTAIKNLHSFGSWMTGQTMLYKTENLRSVGGFDNQLGGLTDLFASYQIASTDGAVFIPRYMAAMRKHNGGFLMNSLVDSQSINRIFEKIDEKCISSNKSILFNLNFSKKLKMRILFSSLICFINAKKTPDDIYFSKISNLINVRITRIVLKIQSKILSTLILFILLRPFDILWIYYYRYLKFYKYKN